MSTASYLVDAPVELHTEGLSEILVHPGWGQHLPEEERAYLQSAEQQLLRGAIQLATRTELAEEQAEAALTLGHRYGRLMATTRRTLPEAVLGFVLFRDALLATTLEHSETSALDHRATLELVTRVNALLTGVTQAMISAFEAI